MDEALDTFLERNTITTRLVADRLSVFLSDEEKSDYNWALRELCTHIVHANPLNISSAQHSIFYTLIREFAAPFESPRPSQYIIVINGGAKFIEISYLAGLAIVLKALSDPRIHTRLQSVNDLPRCLILPFLKRSGFRTYLMRKIFASVEDSLDVMQLYKEAVIGAATMESLLSMQKAAINAGNYETPINESHQYGSVQIEELEDQRSMAEIVLEQYDDDGEGEELHPPILVPNSKPLPPLQKFVLLPLRRSNQHRRVGFGSIPQLHMLCTIYSYLRPAIDNVMLAMDMSHARERTLCSLEFLFSALHTHITESLDNQSSGSRALRELYSDCALDPLFSRVDEIGQEIIKLGRGHSNSLMLRMHYETHSSFASEFYAEMEKKFPEFSYTAKSNPDQVLERRWLPVQCSAAPVSLLIARLTANGSLLTPMIQLKSFLHRERRTEYLAYELPIATTRVSLELALITVRKRYAPMFPVLFTQRHMTLVSRQIVYLVARPEYVEMVKLLMLLESLADRNAMQSNNFYTSVFIKALVVARPNTLLHDVASYCVTHALAILLGGKRGHSQMAQPGDDNYALYRYLPQLLQLFPNVEDTKHRKAILGFLFPKRRSQKLSGSSMSMLLDRGVEAFPEEPHLQKELTSLCKKTFENGIWNYEDCVLKGRRKATAWVTIYDCVLSGRHTLTQEECYYLLVDLGIERQPKMFRRPTRRIVDVNKSGAEPTQRLYSAQSLRDENQERLRRIIQSKPLFEADTVNLSTERLATDSAKQFARTEFAFPRVFNTVPNCYRQLAESLMRAEQLAFCYPGQYISIPGHSVLNSQHVNEHQFDFQLLLDEQDEVFFEECLFLYDNPKEWTQAPAPDSDLLCSSPMNTVIDCGQLLELALLYNEDWIPGQLTKGSVYAGGHYTTLVRDVQRRTETIPEAEYDDREGEGEQNMEAVQQSA